MTKKRKEAGGSEEIFIYEYFKHGNASKAARDAGYSLKSSREIGYRLLNREHIKAALDSLRRERKKAWDYEIDEWALDLKAITKANIMDVITIKDGKIKLREGLEREDMLGIASVRHTISDGPQGYREEVSVQLQDKASAFKMLGVHIGAIDKEKDKDAGSASATDFGNAFGTILNVLANANGQRK